MTCKLCFADIKLLFDKDMHAGRYKYSMSFVEACTC